jgi:hypothetical protein
MRPSCHTRGMAKHPKPPRDPNQLARLIVDLASGKATENAPPPPTPVQEFARSGGLKGGKARADALSPEQRKEIASIAGKGAPNVFFENPRVQLSAPSELERFALCIVINASRAERVQAITQGVGSLDKPAPPAHFNKIAGGWSVVHGTGLSHSAVSEQGIRVKKLAGTGSTCFANDGPHLNGCPPEGPDEDEAPAFLP